MWTSDFSFMLAQTNRWTNSRKVSGLRGHRDRRKPMVHNIWTHKSHWDPSNTEDDIVQANRSMWEFSYKGIMLELTHNKYITYNYPYTTSQTGHEMSIKRSNGHPGPLLLTWFKFNPCMDSSHMPGKVWGEITFSFLKFKCCTAEV